MIESNINIISNIYIRSDPDIRNDRKYAERITGAKMLRELKKNYGISLSAIQEKIANEGLSCSYAKNGEMSWGAILENGTLKWVNRCENISCHMYDECVTDRIPKIIPRKQSVEDYKEDDLQKFLETLGISKQGDEFIFERDKNPEINETEELPKDYEKPSEQTADELKQAGSLYIEIAEPSRIINAPLDSHIILNSGPGTGKTYTIIQRLIYILANGLCPAEEIYILCYTRSAKNVIERKLDAAVENGIIQPSAKNICVLTFDSYATYFLMDMKEQGVITDDLNACDYNARIRLFNEHISAEDLEGISYFIVDEIQDLVNDRANMVLKMLEYVNCGFLLAGDRCQAIYDYDADNGASIDSVKFYEQAEKLFPSDIQRYEITENRRQVPDLAKESSQFRRILLNESFKEQNRYANEVIKKYATGEKIETYIKNLHQSPSETTAILCRGNGEAEYISSLLCENRIRHTLNRGVNIPPSLPRWVADIFWDYCRETIGKNDFIERFNFRCNFRSEPEFLWDQLCSMTKSRDNMEISISDLVKALSVANNIPKALFEEPPLLTVSTIHKAKGSEFDKVILIASEIKPVSDRAEEARVRYVALTRPKSQLIVMRKNKVYFKKSLSGRPIKTGLRNYYYKKKTHCELIALGFTGDIESNSFASGDFDSVLGLQEYIINSVHLYDKLTAEYSEISELYDIIHNEHKIGSFSKQMFNELILGVESTYYRNIIPNRLENIYVSGITTEILRKSSDNIPIEYQKSKFCFGIQITGLARLVFKKR